MKTRLPTSQEIEELVAYLPRLYRVGFKPIKRWRGGEEGKDGIMQMPYPEYDNIDHRTGTIVARLLKNIT